MNKLMLWLIDKYQKNKTTHGHCRYYPSCSNYAKEAYQKFNFFYASYLTFFRIIRCTPFTKRKYDPVPLTKKEKYQQSILNDLKKNYDPSLVTKIYQFSFQKNLSKDMFINIINDYLFGSNNNPTDIYNDKVFLEYHYDNLIKTTQRLNIDVKYTPPHNSSDILSIVKILSDAEIINLGFNVSIEDFKINYQNNYYLYPSKLISDKIYFDFLKKDIDKATFIGINADEITPLIQLIIDYLNIEVIDLNTLFNDESNDLTTELLKKLDKQKTFVYNNHIYDFTKRKKYIIIKKDLINASNSCIFNLTISTNNYNHSVNYNIIKK